MQLETDTEPSDTWVGQGTPRESLLPSRPLKIDFNSEGWTLPQLWPLALWAEKLDIGYVPAKPWFRGAGSYEPNSPECTHFQGRILWSRGMGVCSDLTGLWEGKSPWGCLVQRGSVRFCSLSWGPMLVIEGVPVDLRGCLLPCLVFEWNLWVIISIQLVFFHSHSLYPKRCNIIKSLFNNCISVLFPRT